MTVSLLSMLIYWGFSSGIFEILFNYNESSIDYNAQKAEQVRHDMLESSMYLSEYMNIQGYTTTIMFILMLAVLILFYQEKKYWPFILPFVHLWKGLGFSTVVYLASIVGISPELYEAARMDGASKWQQIRNVTLPNLVPTAITLFSLSVGKIFFSDFGLFYQVPRNSGMLFSATQTIDTYVYNALMVNNNIALSSAASVLQSLCGVVCILLANWVVRKISEENAMF